MLENFPVRPGTLYAATWKMKIEGEKSWRFRAEFAGVILNFTDEAGQTIASMKRNTSCYQTDGARDGWIIFRAPERAARVSVLFAIVSPEPLAGKFTITSPRVVNFSDATTPEKGKAALSISVRDEAGVPTSARIYVRDAHGEYFAPPFAFSYELGGRCFYLQDPALGRMEVPPGDYKITAMKGFENTIASNFVSIREGETKEIALKVNPRFENHYAGWYAGDHHTHLFRHGGSLYPMMNIQDVYTIAKAEGLDYLPFMGVDKVKPEERKHSDPGFIALVTDELTRDLWGHLCPIGVTQLRAEPERGDAWPMNADLIDAAMQAHGAIAYAHPYGPLRKGREFDSIADTKSGLIAREFPIDLALGLPCSLDILTKEDAAGEFDLKLRDTMRLLNLGFHFGLTGSTDFHLDQGRQPIGGLRTYVHADALDWTGVVKAYNEGRTFATNGPMLALRVNKALPGDAITIKPKKTVTCEIEAESLWGVGSVEIWMNGKIVHEAPAQRGYVKRTVTIRAPESGWMLAIARGAPTPLVMSAAEGKPVAQGQIAITSPIYITVEGQPLRMNAADAEYFVHWIDAVEAAFQKEVKEEGEKLTAEQVASVKGRLKKAKSAYEEKVRAGSSIPSRK